MAKLLDEIVIIDLEATCWEDGNHNRKDKQQSEIIEIGVCSVNLIERTISKKESIIVKPERSTVSAFCTTLTTLTQDDVSKGITLDQACHKLSKEYRTELRAWGSWGDYDRAQFERECSSKQVRNPFGRTHLNIKSLFSLFSPCPREIGMPEALDKLKLKMNGTHHRGVDDAENIARIFIHMLDTYRKV